MAPSSTPPEGPRLHWACGGGRLRGMAEDLPILIDGTQGEGGGQLLRTALSLSVRHRAAVRHLAASGPGREKPGPAAAARRGGARGGAALRRRAVRRHGGRPAALVRPAPAGDAGRLELRPRHRRLDAAAPPDALLAARAGRRPLHADARRRHAPGPRAELPRPGAGLGAGHGAARLPLRARPAGGRLPPRGRRRPHRARSSRRTRCRRSTCATAGRCGRSRCWPWWAGCPMPTPSPRRPTRRRRSPRSAWPRRRSGWRCRCAARGAATPWWWPASSGSSRATAPRGPASGPGRRAAADAPWPASTTTSSGAARSTPTWPTSCCCRRRCWRRGWSSRRPAWFRPPATPPARGPLTSRGRPPSSGASSTSR